MVMPQPWSTPETDHLLDGLAILSQIFWGPTLESCQTMTEPAYSEALRDLQNFDKTNHVEALLGFMARFPDAQSLFEALDERYVRLFVSSRGGAAAHLYQSCYDGDQGLLMGRPAETMRQRLENAGLNLEALGNEPPDHLSVELEYLVLLMESALREGSPDSWREVKDFAALELKPWLRRFSKDLNGAPDCSFYDAATGLLLSLVEAISGLDLKQ